MELDPALRAALKDVAHAMLPAQREWWIIASAAMALHGVDPGTVRDIDVLLDPRDAPAVLGALGLEPRRGSGDSLFRSDLFVRWDGAALPVEFFAGFHLFEQGAWHAIALQSRQAVDLGGSLLYVPAADELLGLFRRFGRPKDLVRAAALSASGRFPSSG